MTESRPSAFTLIEVTAVLVLIGLMASAAALSLRSAYRGSQMQDVIDRIVWLDQSARRIARINGTNVVLKIDRASGRLDMVPSQDDPATLSPVVLPDGFSIHEAHVGRPVDDNDRLTINKDGLSPTYAFTLMDSKGNMRTLVFAGLTGQHTELEHHADFNLQTLLVPTWTDAD